MGLVEEISEAVGHAFWDTQPVPSLNAEEDDACGPINPADPEKVRAEPYNLPPAFEWTDLDLSDAEQAKELYTLLHENYVEDGDAMFRFDYSLDFIRWAMQPPGALDYWHVGVRVSQTKKLVAFIGATPADLLCHGQRVEPRPPPAADKAEEGEGGAGASGVNMEEKLSGLDLDGGATGSAASSGGGAAELGDQAVVEVNFLCVHKKLRSKRLAPVLIREVTRRVNEKGIFQATYTAGVVLPRPVARCRYWHRSLNPKKLIEVRTLKLYALPDQPVTKGVRALKEEDVPSCCAKLNAYLRRYKLTPQLSEAEFSHWLVPRKGVIYTYVVEEAGEDGEKEVTDMFSFYSLPSSVLKHEKHTKLHAAYCYYYFANKTPVQQLISDALAPRQAAAGHGGRPLTPHGSSRRRWSSPSGTSLTSSTRSTSSTTTPCSRSSSSASEMGTCSTTCTTGGAPRSWPRRLASSSSEAPTACNTPHGEAAASPHAPWRPPCVPAACDRRFASFATRALRQRGARSTPGGGRSSLSSWMRVPSSACRQRSLQHDLSRAMRLRRGVGDTH